MAGKAKLGSLISATKCVQIGDQNKEWLLQKITINMDQRNVRDLKLQTKKRTTLHNKLYFLSIGGGKI